MSAKPAPRFDEMSRKWLALVERRLAYYAGLYQSGRWRRYYTPQGFAAHIGDAMKAVAIWKELAGQAPAPAGENDLRPAA